MQLEHFGVDDPSDAILNALAQTGACIVDELIEPALCDRLMADFQPHIESAPWCNTEAGNDAEGDDFFGRRTKRFHGLVSLSESAGSLVAHPRLLELAALFLGRGDACREIRVSTTELMVLGSSQGRQMLHRDADSWIYLPPEIRQRLLFSANVALCDFTEINGATIVAPGSHCWTAERKASNEEVCLAVMGKGSALIYRGDVLHGGGDNHNDALRTGFYVGYIPSWLACLENHALSNSAEAIAGFSEEVRRLFNLAEPFQTFP